MKEREADTQCPCGAHLVIRMRKPTLMAPTVQKKQCGVCETTILVRCTKKEFEYAVEFELLQISPIATEIIKWRLKHGSYEFPHPRGLKGLIAWISRRFRV